MRALARLVTVVTVVAAYVALQMAASVGVDLRTRARFRDAPAQAVAFVSALDRSAEGDVREGAAWFKANAPSGKSRSAVAAAAGDAEAGKAALARQRVAGLSALVRDDQAALQGDLDASGAAALWSAVAAAVLLVPTLWLRRRRRAGAAEIVALVRRFAPRQPRWRRPVFLVASGTGYALFAAGIFAVSVAQQQGYKMTVEAQVLLLPSGLAALGAGVLILRYTRPRSARGAAQALLADGRGPVLYLRSFADDDAMARVDDGGVAVNLHSREEQLVGSLNAFGPVIAVGRPGEPLPRLGAARFYLPLNDWQPAVLRMMELSQLIVLNLGLGEGLWWEVEQARATQPARKLLLLAPGGRSGVAERLDEHLPTPSRLDEVVSGGSDWISAVIAFGPKWTPHVHPVGAVPGATSKRGRGGFARLRTRVKEAGLVGMTWTTPAYQLARAIRAALASVGVRKRGLVYRSGYAAQKGLWKGIALVTALILLCWLGYRALQAFGLS